MFQWYFSNMVIMEIILIIIWLLYPSWHETSPRIVENESVYIYICIHILCVYICTHTWTYNVDQSKDILDSYLFRYPLSRSSSRWIWGFPHGITVPFKRLKGVPLNGGFTVEHPPKNGWFADTPILENLHLADSSNSVWITVYIYIYICMYIYIYTWKAHFNSYE